MHLHGRNEKARVPGMQSCILTWGGSMCVRVWVCMSLVVDWVLVEVFSVLFCGWTFVCWSSLLTYIMCLFKLLYSMQLKYTFLYLRHRQIKRFKCLVSCAYSLLQRKLGMKMKEENVHVYEYVQSYEHVVFACDPVCVFMFVCVSLCFA